MLCPNCKHELRKVRLDKVEVDHCDNCGSTLFDANEINRITLSDARLLSKMKCFDSISGIEKFSPTDNSPLKRIEDESVPQHVTLLKSDTTGEIFSFADDLVEFKKAQKAKISYYKTWRIPMPAIKSVLVYSFVIISSLSLVYLSSRLTTPTSQTTQASTLCIGDLQIIKTNTQYVVSCQTSTELICNAQVLCNGFETTVNLSSQPSHLHLGSVPANCKQIQLVCTDNNQTIDTDWIDL